MKVVLTICLIYMIPSAKCGLVKEFFGTVSNEMHKLAKGSVVVNTVHEIVQVKKEIITDFSNIINPNNYLKSKNNQEYFNTNAPNQIELSNTDNNEFSLISKPTENINEFTPPLDNKPSNKLVPENTIFNMNKEKEQFIQTSTEFIKPIVFNQNGSDAEITEFDIEPRIAREISPSHFENQTRKEDNVTAETNVKKETDFNIEESFKNEHISNETLNSTTDAYGSIALNFDSPQNNSDVIEIVVVDGCPEGFEVAADGSCDLPFDAGNDTRQEGKNRANFVAGCFQGYAHAEDGTCQEIIYD